MANNPDDFADFVAEIQQIMNEPLMASISGEMSELPALDVAHLQNLGLQNAVLRLAKEVAELKYGS